MRASLFKNYYFDIQSILIGRDVSMGKAAFIFPGQGAQYIGMGRDFYEQIPVSREMFDLASEASGLDIPALCFEQNEKINITEYTQIAMLAMEVAVLKAVEGKGCHPDVTAGLSLGEYGALAAAGVMDVRDVFRVVRKRGIYMQEAVPVGGAMTAVLGLEASQIENVCEEAQGLVSIANYNCPGQIVITGEAKAVAQATDALTAAGAKRCVPLKVSGPFHSELLKGAGEKLGEALSAVAVHEINIPYSFGTFRIPFVVFSARISFITCFGTFFNEVILGREQIYSTISSILVTASESIYSNFSTFEKFK